MGRGAGSNENKALSFKLSLSLAIPAWKTILRIIIPECGHLGTQSSILKNSKHIFSAGAASNKHKMKRNIGLKCTKYNPVHLKIFWPDFR